MRNLESRVYAELSRQLVNNLFGETPSSSGTITLEGNTIEYTSDGVTLTLKITEADGTVTEITIPIGTFTFLSSLKHCNFPNLYKSIFNPLPLSLKFAGSKQKSIIICGYAEVKSAFNIEPFGNTPFSNTSLQSSAYLLQWHDSL